MDNLTPEMKERLEKWRQNLLIVKSAEIFRSPGNFVPRGRDYGDDLSEFKKQEKE